MLRLLPVAALLCACAPAPTPAEHAPTHHAPTPTPEQPAPAETPTQPKVVRVDGNGDAYDPDAAKAEALAKMAAGTATKAELRLLVAICMVQRDRACRNEAYARWKAMP